MATITFRTGTPAEAMTREQTVTWLLGTTAPMGMTAGLATSYAVTSMVDTLARNAGTQVMDVETAHGERYELSCTRTGRIFARVCTYSAVRVG